MPLSQDAPTQAPVVPKSSPEGNRKEPSMPERNNELAAAIARVGRPKYIIAAESRLAGPTISEIVAGRLTPSPAQAQRLADVLGISIETVTGGAS